MVLYRLSDESLSLHDMLFS